MSVVAETEAYNESCFDERPVETFQKFLRINPSVGQHFKRKVEADIEGADENSEEKTDGWHTPDEQCLMYEMKRKSLGWALLKHEMVAELRDRDMKTETFGPKREQDVRRTFRETADDFMTKIDKVRQNEIYPHKKCYPACEARGCKYVVAAIKGVSNVAFICPICTKIGSKKGAGIQFSPYFLSLIKCKTDTR